MKKLYLFLIIALIVTFSACKNKTSSKNTIEKFDKETEYLYLGKFNITQTNNPGIIRFVGSKGTVFLSTTFFEESQQAEITIGTSDCKSQERYYLMDIKSDVITFANDNYIIQLLINTPLTIAEENSITNKTITIEGLLHLIVANKTVGISRTKSMIKFNSTTIR